MEGSLIHQRNRLHQDPSLAKRQGAPDTARRIDHATNAGVDRPDQGLSGGDRMQPVEIQVLERSVPDIEPDIVSHVDQELRAQAGEFAGRTEKHILITDEDPEALARHKP